MYQSDTLPGQTLGLSWSLLLTRQKLFERIEKEPANTCLYRRLFLDYTYGLGRSYTEEEIQAAKASPSFEREYNLKYLGLIGNVFHTKDIDAVIEKGKALAQQFDK